MKAVWGYDPEFMVLMLAALGVAGEDIAAGDVWVATGADGQIAGVVALAPSDALDLNKLFIAEGLSALGSAAQMRVEITITRGIVALGGPDEQNSLYFPS